MHLLNFILYFWAHKHSPVDRIKSENVMFPFNIVCFAIVFLCRFSDNYFCLSKSFFSPFQSHLYEYLELFRGLMQIQVLLDACLQPIMEIAWACKVVDFTSPIYDPWSVHEAILISINMCEKPALMHITFRPIGLFSWV